MAVRAITTGEKAKQRGGKQYSQVFVIPRVPNVLYTARLAVVPTTHDMVAEIEIETGSGTIADVRLDMKVLVGTAAGGDDLGFCRIRKLPDVDIYGEGTLFVGELSHIDWHTACHITIVDDYDIYPRPIRIINGVVYVDYEIAYSDQHTAFEPIVNMGGHRVLSLDPVTGTVSHVRNCTDEGSQVFDGTIAAYLWEAPNASTLSGETTDEATIEYDTAGHYVEYCTLTTDDGKTFMGARYTFVVDRATLVSLIHSLRVSEGVKDGITMTFDMSVSAALTDFRHRAFVIAFAIDYYNGIEETISYRQYEGNILGFGRIAQESITFNDEMGLIRFVSRDWKYWMRMASAFPFGLERAENTPAAWTTMPGLNVDRATWALLHYYSTGSRIADIHLSGDTRYAAELSSTASNLASQLDEVTLTTIYADLVFDAFGIGWLRIEPQLIPDAERFGWVQVQEITSDDWAEELSVELNTHEEMSQMNSSGVFVPQYGTAAARISLSYGHIYAPFGDPSVTSNLLLKDQAHSNSLAGLFMGWDNRMFDSLAINFIGNNRMFSIAEYCRARIVLDETYNPRGFRYDGFIVPRSITKAWDSESGFLNTVVDFQDESIEQPAITGDFPEDTGISGEDYSQFPLPSIPSIPPSILPLIPLPAPEVNPNKPKRVVIASTKGVLYTENANADTEAEIIWKYMNEGLLVNDIPVIENILVTPAGGMYLFTAFERVYYASGLGATWTQIASSTDFPYGVQSIGVNPTANDQVLICGNGNLSAGLEGNIKIASYGSLTTAPSTLPMRDYRGATVWSSGKWLVFGSASGVFTTAWAARFSAGGTLEYSGSIATVGGQDASQRFAQTIGSSDKVIQWDGAAPGGFNVIETGGTIATRSTVFTAQPNHQAFAFSPTGMHAMASTGALFTPYKTIDGGLTWTSLAGTLPTGGDIFENCHDDNRWIFGGGTVIRATLDQGATAYGITGNLTYIAALLDITHIRYLS